MGFETMGCSLESWAWAWGVNFLANRKRGLVLCHDTLYFWGMEIEKCTFIYLARGSYFCLCGRPADAFCAGQVRSLLRSCELRDGAHDQFIGIGPFFLERVRKMDGWWWWCVWWPYHHEITASDFYSSFLAGSFEAVITFSRIIFASMSVSRPKSKPMIRPVPVPHTFSVVMRVCGMPSLLLLSAFCWVGDGWMRGGDLCVYICTLLFGVSDSDKVKSFWLSPARFLFWILFLLHRCYASARQESKWCDRFSWGLLDLLLMMRFSMNSEVGPT